VHKKGYMRVEGHGTLPTAVNSANFYNNDLCIAPVADTASIAAVQSSAQPPFPLTAFI